MKFDIITIFPKVFGGYLNESILKRAQEKRLVDIKIWDLRKFVKVKHKKGLPAAMRSFGRVDDKPYGGGPGMVLKIEPLARALYAISRKPYGVRRTAVILLSASGKQFNAKMAANFAKKHNHIILIAGHYEGVDERIKSIIVNCKLKIENLSIGPYVLTGGELPAMVIVDAISRHIPGVLGKAESLEEKRHGMGVPAYTRPEAFKFLGKKYRVPKVLLSGDHKKIAAWRQAGGMED